mmetsp:Transcript_166674/g.535181  ORF Transcript_166674/g.535181 Transcript_166674/m.535181 type:complete len:234 (-) Transcript_166674:81-782(-)|eukprot:CAMPEP_0177223948 /NCGR_PEP_ID=MMETSP0367-20130122/38758_1 /TAXON_ID=447022 ORGANISM="Scrippsiella hangoei-like, Strain SHHI-4" /NCGR_SAMPLE_ID=MMETSP0367 /ASSEMBLY_ACC=CAM_ASM_000362 /LENGTH=233 /DNA_ID=CAMNT_0018673955 /DNA_START=48 /DNA_END=749 /DNA_ORIENTATION=-
MADLRTQLGDEDDEEEPEYLQYKIIILGDGAVGKTSLATRFCEDHFAKHYKQTIGLDFFVKRVQLPGDVNVCMQIWDIGGQSIGGKMVSNYIHGSHAVVLVYDITNYQSFQHLEDWLFLVKRTFNQDNMPYMALMANKHDLSHIRAVKSEKHDKFAEENDLYSYYVSARTGDNVQPSFFRIAADLAGVTLTKPELEVAQKPTKAELINHQRHDPAYEEANHTDINANKKCTIM